MAALIGLVLGALLGRWYGPDWATMVGGLIGFFVGALVASQRERRAFRKPERLDHVARATTVEMRIDAIEQRLDAIERLLGTEPGSTRPAVTREDALRVQQEPLAVEADAPAMRHDPPLTREEAHGVRDEVPVTRDGTRVDVAVASVTRAIDAPAPGRADAPRTQGALAALWAWFIGGNAMTRIGVVVLFFGVAFLLRYFAEHFTVPIAVRLAGVALVGVALVVVGWRVARTRAAYGWALQGAGMGVLYLTTYAAFHEFGLFGPGTALVLLAMLSAALVALAFANDAQVLASLAVAGAFLAPALTGSDRTALTLFSYYAVVNATVFVAAMARQWRALTITGFVFTFVLGGLWGREAYTPDQLLTCEAFLVLFFAMYLALTIAHARGRIAPSLRQQDGLLVFALPVLAFATQAMLMRDTRYGAAWSALVLALVYALLASWLRAARDDYPPLLARSFALLAAVFASIAIPFAFAPRVTSALWAVEGALVYWLGVQQRAPASRVFGAALQVAAAAMFVREGGSAGAMPVFANASFIGALLVGVAGLFIARLGERDPASLSERERALLPWFFGWGALWLWSSGMLECMRAFPRTRQPDALVAWFAGVTLLAMLMVRSLSWPRLRLLALPLPLAMVLAFLVGIGLARSTLHSSGAVAWVAAWAVVAFALRSLDNAAAANDSDKTRWRGVHHALHVAAAIGFTSYVAWEASEAVARHTEHGTVWVASVAALCAVAYLLAIEAAERRGWWPLTVHLRAYQHDAGAPIAAMLFLWAVFVNVLSPGDAAPLPYVPIINPLEIALAAAIFALWRWSAGGTSLGERGRYAALGALIFVTLNGGILRIGHHYAEIPWSASTLLASRPLQAALTLAWSATAVVVMSHAARRGIRALWMVGAALLGIVVLKLFIVDLGALSGLPRVVAFLGVGALLLVIGYVSPLPPSGQAAER